MAPLRVSPRHSSRPLTTTPPAPPLRRGQYLINKATAHRGTGGRREVDLKSQLRVDKLALLSLPDTHTLHTLCFTILCTVLSSRGGKPLPHRSLSTMAARALTAAGRTRTTPLLASCRNGGSMNHSSATASARREEEQYKDVRTAAAARTGAQVEAALNRKNVEVLQGKEHVATVLPDETIGGALDGGEDASWVPDQDTGVFGPAHVDTHGGAAHPAPPHLFGGATADTPAGLGSASVLDQAVFVREEDMEDVERPAAVDMANANADVNDSIKNY